MVPFAMEYGFLWMRAKNSLNPLAKIEKPVAASVSVFVTLDAWPVTAQ
jgi:hypothetical protein